MRHYSGWMGRLIHYLAAVVALYHLLFASGFLLFFNIDIGGRHTGISVGLVLAVVFLLMPPTKDSAADRLPWYDVILALCVAIPSFYYAWDFERILYSSLTPNPWQIALGLVLFVASLEAARRAIGWALVISGLVFLLYPPFAQYLPGILSASPIRWDRLVGDIYLGTQGVFSTAAEVFSTIIASFIVFGMFIKNTGAGDFFVNAALSLLGRFRGGAAKSCVLGSALFGTMSGIAVANVMTTGSVTIPLMKRTGYSPEFAAGVEATASVGGAILPPVMGILAFIMADFLGVSYWTVAVAAFIPATLYYVAIYFQVDFHSAKNGLLGVPRTSLPSFRKTIKRGWYYLLPLTVIVFLFAQLGWSPTRVGFYAVASIFIIFVVESLIRKRHDHNLGPQTMKILDESTVSLARIMPAALIAGMIMASVNLTALGLRLSGGLIQLSGGNLFVLLLLTMFASLLMGMFADLIVIYLVLAVLVAPSLIEMGILPMAAHLFILYYTVLGLLTPPVCIAAYAAAGVAESNPFRTGLQATRLAVGAMLVPYVFVYFPALILRGPPLETAIIAATTAVGLIAFGGAFEGWVLTRTSLWERVFLGVSGILLMHPTWLSGPVGLALFAVVVVIQFVKRKRSRLSQQPSTTSNVANLKDAA